MRSPSTRRLWRWAIGSAALVYRDTVARAKLLARTVRRRDRADGAFDDVLAANAEPASLPEPLLRSKVG